MSFFLANWIFPLLKMRNGIPKTTSTLRSANKNVSWKNRALPSLFSIWKLTKTIPNVSRMEPLIFKALTLIGPSWPHWSRFFHLRRSFFSRQALAEDSELLERGIDDSKARTLGFSYRRSFINWPWVLALALATTVFFTI